MPQHIIVEKYNPLWKNMYAAEAENIRGILKEELICIYHIGSTAVENLCAKPVIDIMPVVRDINKVDAYYSEFEALGYECMGEFGIEGRRYFRKGGDNRTHQMHIFQYTNETEIIRHLAVRDYLRAHPDEAALYGELKTLLALKYPYDIEAYCSGKDEFVKELERKALKEYKNLPIAEV